MNKLCCVLNMFMQCSICKEKSCAQCHSFSTWHWRPRSGTTGSARYCPTKPELQLHWAKDDQTLIPYEK